MWYRRGELDLAGFYQYPVRSGIILAISAALLLTRLRPKITEGLIV